MNKIFKYVTFLLGLIILPLKAFAVCPVCAIAVGAGVGFSRWLGVDDLITGLWVGALTIAMVMWTINWFDKKNINFKFRNWTTFLAYILLVLVPLYFTGIIGHLNAYFLIFDKLSLGIIIGGFVFWFMSWWYQELKKKNNGHAYFHYQKVVMPVGALTILSVVIYFLIK